MRHLKSISKLVGVILLAVFLIIGGVHLYLYTRGNTYIIQIPNTEFTIKLGKSPQSTNPKEIDASFKKIVVDNKRIIRVPLYEDNVIVDMWNDGTLYAHDVRTGEKKQYDWIDETAYICVDSRRLLMVTDDKYYKPPDPKDTLSNYKFTFWDDGFRGEQGASGFFHFEADVEPGIPAKLILVNRTPNENNGFWLLNIFLFTNKDCSEFEV